MALTTAERTNIIKLVVGMFNAAPGATYLAELTVAFEANGRSLSNLAKDLALTPAYKSLNPVFQTAAEFATAFLTPLGLQANAIAVDFVTAKFNAGVSKGQIAYEAIVALDASTATEFADAKAIVTNKTTAAEYYSVTLAATTTNIASLQQSIGTVTKDAASVTAANTANASGSTSGSGLTLVLSSGVDTLTGSGSNDTFTADNTGTNAQSSPADTITGGSGTDTLRIFSKSGTNALDLLPSLNGVENLYINGANYGTLTLDTSGVSGLTSVTLDGATTGTASATTTLKVAGQSVTLQNSASTNNNATDYVHTTAITSTTDTAQSVTVNKYANVASIGNAANKTSQTLDIAGTKVTALTVTGTGATSSFTLTNTGAALATLNVAGDKNVTVTADITSLKTVNASTATGNVAFNAGAQTTDNQLTFTGGAGADNVTFKAAFLTGGAAGDVLDGGAGTDTLTINDTAPVYTAINAAKNFEVLALGTTGATVDTAQITSLTSYSVKNTGTTIFQNSSNATTYAIDNTGVTAVTVANTVGQGTANVTLSNTTTTAAAKTLATLTLTGASTINLVSNNDGQAANTHVITNLVNGDNSAIVITGAAGLTATLNGGTAVGSSVDGSAATGKLGITGSNFGDVIKGGTAVDTLTGGAGADTLTGNAGNDVFVFATRATTQLNFAAGDTTTSNIDKITDFTGNGALAGDTIQIGVGAAAFGGHQFTTTSTATVTAVTVATAASFTALAAAIQAASAGVASSGAVAQVYDVTVTAGALAGRFLVLNDDTAAVAATDTFISITGAAALNAQDFTFA